MKYMLRLLMIERPSLKLLDNFMLSVAERLGG